MAMARGCTCGFLPCICVHSTDDDAHAFVDVEPFASNGVGGSRDDPESCARAAAKANLRSLFAANATTECMMCMFMPCICPAEDEAFGGGEETTSVEATSPLGSEGFGGMGEDEDEAFEETDAYGRVRISSGEEGDSGDVWIAKEIKRFLKPHQVEGVNFLQSNISADRGCILADYMGLGKTMQVVTVVYSYILDQIEKNSTANPATTIVLCPAICIPNWESEFKKWLSVESLKRCPVFALDSSNNKGTMNARIRLLQQWKRDGGVLLMGYEMFRSLLNPTLSAAIDRDANIQVCTRVGDSTMEITSSISTKAQKSSREFYKLLCQPGADLVVLDEGHRMKDPTSLLCQSVAKIQSKRRLVLTGYPVQNSLSEYWCMVNFARDGFLGTYEEFRAKYEKPIVDGDAARSRELIDKLKDVVLRRGQSLLKKQLPPKKEWILYCKLSPIQHRLYCDFLDFYGDAADGKATADLLSAYAALLQVMNHPDIIRWKLYPEGHERDDEDVDSSQSSAWNDGGSGGGWNWEPEEKLAEKRQLAFEQSRKRKQKITNRQKSFEWARPVFSGEETIADQHWKRPVVAGRLQDKTKQQPPQRSIYETMVLDNSGKMAMLMQIIEESFACDDKVVVFSQSVPTLKIISEFLRVSAFSPSGRKENANAADAKAQSAAKMVATKRRKPSVRPNRDPAGILRKRKSLNSTQDKKVQGKTVASAGNASASVSSDEWFLQIDGSTTGAKRMEYIETFSSKESPVKLLLVSTRAGAEGINLHAANRLVLFDVSWNPSNDHQSMCRSHRIGQGKTVHVYRLVSTGTMERMIYEQQMKKVDLSTSVVDNHETPQTTRTSEPAAAAESETAAPFSGFLQPPSEQEYEKQVSVDESLIGEDQVLVSCVQKAGNWLRTATLSHNPISTQPAQDEQPKSRRAPAAFTSTLSMAPRSSSIRTVGVDVTAHKEERDLTDPRKKTKLRVRYYVELVVGSVRERHTRLGFSGSFQTLMALHETFLRAYLNKYGDQLQHAQQHGLTTTTSTSRASLSSSTSSSTSHSSLSSSSPRGGVKKLVNSFRIKKHIPTEPNAVNLVPSSSHRNKNNNQSEEIALPFLPPFPTSNKLLVRLESGEAKDDSKISARSSALFDYYFQLFNSEEGELFLEIIQLRSIEQAEKDATSNSNGSDSQDASSPQSTRGGLFKFLSRHSKSSNSDVTKRLEFSVPVQVSSSGKVRSLKHTKPRSESSMSRSR